MTAAIRLADLFAGIASELPELSVIDITSDSRRVVPGSLFVACRGVTEHGLTYLPQALANGAAGVVWQPELGLSAPLLPTGISGFPVAGLSQHVGMLADRFFAQPSAKLNIAGITGTNGKTTTAWLLAHAIEHLQGGAAYMGTLGYGSLAAPLESSSLTTPGVISVHRRLQEMVVAGAEFVAMEVSSHGLDQGRLDGVRFKTVACTNLTRDHLDYHGNMAAYAKAKQRLFTDFEFETAIVNVANDFGRELAGLLHKDVHLLTVSTDPSDEAMLCAELLATSTDGLHIRLSGEFGEVEFQSPLWGRFNVENLVVAAGILIASGVCLNDVAAALAVCTAPAGRMEVLGGDSQPLVIVDFAHTPDALEQVLQALREHCAGKIWCVFGCGGDRDRGKRSEMGAVAARLADHTILTDDNPRDEAPEQIVAEILAGFAAVAKPDVVHDRARAISKAVTSARSSDVVLIAGKGAESYQLEGSVAKPFADRDVALRALGEVA
jgi:UDP-N-acetylmuramoyl-L-alanyl-D-glutamate--2,6-diaminopimelate ligase